MKKDIIRVSRNIMLPVMILLFSLQVSAEAADTKRAQAPPPGWQAAGESVAGPEETSAAAQTAARGSADAQVRHERDARVRKTDNKGYIYYSVLYGEYDEYPHARPRRRRITPDTIHEHVDYRSDNRVRRQDVYIHTE